MQRVALAPSGSMVHAGILSSGYSTRDVSHVLNMSAWVYSPTLSSHTHTKKRLAGRCTGYSKLPRGVKESVHRTLQQTSNPFRGYSCHRQ